MQDHRTGPSSLDRLRVSPRRTRYVVVVAGAGWHTDRQGRTCYGTSCRCASRPKGSRVAYTVAPSKPWTGRLADLLAGSWLSRPGVWVVAAVLLLLAGVR
jgi:hypothetical protein